MPVLTVRNVAGALAALALAMPLPAAAKHAAFVRRSNGIEARSGSLHMTVTALADDVLRVRVARGEFGEDASWAVPADIRKRSVPVGAVRITAAPAAAEFRTATMRVRIEGDALRLIISDHADHVISADAIQGAVDIRGPGFTLRKILPADEHYFGLGDKTGPFDHRGQAFSDWNTDAYQFQDSTDPLYKTIPFFIAVGGAAGSYGIFLDNTWRSRFDFGKGDPRMLAFGSSGGAIDYYVIYGPATPQVVERYTGLTGKPPLPPQWALGFQQSRYSYMSADEVRGVAERFRRERIPVDVLWLDIDYQNKNRPFTTNPATFGDMPALTADLLKQDLRLVAITDLHIARAPHQGYAPYDTGVAGDHFVKGANGRAYVGEVWPGPSVFPDFTRSGTRTWWGGLYSGLTAAGVSGFWNDMNEPAVFHTPSKTMPLDVRHRIVEPGFAPRTAAHEEIHNVYGMENSRATFDGLRRLRPGERPFVMTRASYAGGQRYAVTWTGDNSASFKHLSLAIAQMLNLGMSGFAYSGADVGGFIGAPSAELLTKWIEVAAFTPIFRVHSANDAPKREPWLDGPEHTDIRRRFIEERYRLMPYFYALADDNSRTGAPLMRPLFYEFPGAIDMPCKQPTAFMLGERLLIAPPPDFEDSRDYEVCLPPGGWYDFWSGEKVNAGRVNAGRLRVTPALERMPVFVRAGAILPRQPLIQSTSQTPQGPLTLDVYPGNDCRGVIYADDGHSMEFQQQVFLRQSVHCTQTASGVAVDFDAREGRFQPWWRTIEVRVHGWSGGAHAQLDGTPVAPKISPPDETVTVSIADPSQAARLSIDRAAPSVQNSNEIRWQSRQASVEAWPAADERQTYRFSSTSAGDGEASRKVVEEPARPYVRTGNALFDGLYAMALADALQDRVAQIRDDSFNEGRPIDCVCFETGEKWPYVWTRDISYAVDLGMASVDPQRALNSLLFKTSELRPEIVRAGRKPETVVAQDTGSGGSWPVSSDRVVWILAAADVLEYLPMADRPALIRQFYAVARDTLDQDRRFAFDDRAGLYRGETSFLDWREQNYPEWTRTDVSSIASGYALSTNVLHAAALERTAEFARELGDPDAARYRRWARDLRRAVNARFWQARSGMYSSYLGAEPNPVASDSYDLLGLSLAIVFGIADEQQARSILRHYPVSAAGPPVTWPEQPGIAIYHNRALWPFVTAYALRAAKTARHAELAGELAESLMRGSALSLSNMENFEFLTQQVRYEDGALSGPVINSPRQLWSVAGYLSMVQETLWGLRPERGHLEVDPWLPAGLARALFPGRRSVSLHDFVFAGKSVTVTLRLPGEWPATGWLEPRGLSLNGERLNGRTIELQRLRPGSGANEVLIDMHWTAGAAQTITRIPYADSRQLTPAERRTVFAPKSPTLGAVRRTNGAVALTWEGREPEAGVQIYRNGRLLTANAAGERFEDDAKLAPGTSCYSVTQRFNDTALTSLSSREKCLSDAGLITRAAGSTSASAAAEAGLAAKDGSAARVIEGIARYEDWGLPSQELRATFTAHASGTYRFELQYANAHGPINTGITAAVKSMTARCNGDPLQSGSVAMPHLNDGTPWGYSTGFFFKARAGETCELRVADGLNMSYLSHFARYTGGQGGAAGALNRADIAAAQIELVGGPNR